jgi:biotin transport system permease protein
MMEPLYQAPRGWAPLHRMPAGLKLAALVVAGMLVFLLVDLPAVLAACVVAGCAVALTGATPATVWRHVRGLLVLLAILAGTAAWFDGWLHAALVTGRVVALAGLGLAVTFSTRTSDLVDICEQALRPLQRLGLADPGRAALALALALRFIPEIAQTYREIREAQAARGLQAYPWALIVPLMVRTLQRAEEVADAIDARGG